MIRGQLLRSSPLIFAPCAGNLSINRARFWLLKLFLSVMRRLQIFVESLKNYAMLRIFAAETATLVERDAPGILNALFRRRSALAGCRSSLLEMRVARLGVGLAEPIYCGARSAEEILCRRSSSRRPVGTGLFFAAGADRAIAPRSPAWRCSMFVRLGWPKWQKVSNQSKNENLPSTQCQTGLPLNKRLTRAYCQMSGDFCCMKILLDRRSTYRES